jgi:hypothetical protein
MAILGFILMAVAVGLFFARRRQQKRAFNLKTARPVTIAEMESTARAVAQEIGGGDWRDYVKLWGTIQTDHPLTSELKQQPCVYYSFAVMREYEETVQIRNEKGEVRTETQRGTETVSRHHQRVPFYLQDQTGRVLIDPEGADLETVEVLDHFQPGDPAGGQLGFGRFSLQVGYGHGSNRRTLGYRYKESLLPIKRSALVVGTVSDQGGHLTVLKPTQEGQHFIVSLKNDELLTTRAEQNAQRLFLGILGCGLVGLVLVVVDLVS